MPLGFPTDREPATSDGVERRAEALAWVKTEPVEDRLLVDFRREYGRLLDAARRK